MILVEATDRTDLEATCLKKHLALQDKDQSCWISRAYGLHGGQGAQALCIDRYDIPNPKGELPRSWSISRRPNSFAPTRKRICSETEWTIRLRVAQLQAVPYGYHRDSKSL